MWHEATHSGVWWRVASQSSSSVVKTTLSPDLRSVPKVCLNLLFFSSSLWYFWWLQPIEGNLTLKWFCSGARQIWNRMIPKQAAKGEILLKCKFFQGFLPEACRVKLALKHIGILMSWGASTSNLLRITMGMHRNWRLVDNAYICNATFLQLKARLSGLAATHDAAHQHILAQLKLERSQFSCGLSSFFNQSVSLWNNSFWHGDGWLMLHKSQI